MTTNTHARTDLEKVRELADAARIEGFIAYSSAIMQLAAELQDIRDSEQTILAEKCANDEKHCGCVPTLRGEIERLTFDRKELGQLGREAKRLREALELIKVRADQVTELDPEWLIEEIGKIARAELEKKT